MIAIIASIVIAGKPLIFYLGVLTYLSFLLTAAIAILNLKFKIHAIPFKFHPPLAITSIILATIHAFFAISIYYNF